MSSLLRRVLPPYLRPYEPGDEGRIDPPSLEHAARILRFMDWPERMHRYEVRGFEHVPSTGPALIVSPHAFMVIDMFLLGKRIFERDGRVIRGLTDHLVFSIPLMRDLFTTLGVVDGTQANGVRLLESGQLAICMPGGALDWSRSSRQRRTLRWADHRGYAQLAVRTGVPVIPTACPAADDLYLVLNDGWQAGERLRSVLGVKRRLAIPFAVGLGPLPFPVKLTQYVAEPQLPLAEGTEQERVEELDQRVRRILRGLLSSAH